MSKKEIILESILLGKLVHGGQALAEAPNGKKILVWGGIPGELVDIRLTKKKSSYMEGIVSRVQEASADRINPQEPISYLSTSPWQIMKFEAENEAKQTILAESFEREGVSGLEWQDFVAGDEGFGYRNKQEYGFWGDDDGLHLAHFVRGTHGKQMVQGSALAMECINGAARAVRDELSRLKIWGGDLKTIMLRSNQKKQVVGALFIKKTLDMSDFKLPKELKGLDIYYSDPKSPASIPTKKLYSHGDIKLSDQVLGKNIMYDVLSFFQVNLHVFEVAASMIRQEVKDQQCVDFYSGVGTIGIPIGADVLVDSDKANIEMTKRNTEGSDVKVIHAPSEEAIEYIQAEKVLIVDPPRAGLHKDVIEQILYVKPPKVVYLSCNPSTQARDIRLLSESYVIIHAQGYNFFPRTPHIESLVVLELK